MNPSRPHRLLPLLIAIVAVLIAPSAALAAAVGSPDGSYGNDAPFARITPSAGSGFAYDPGGIVALPGGASLVADGDALGVTRLTSGGLLDTAFGTAGTVDAKSLIQDNSAANAVAVTPNGYLAVGTAGGALAVARFTTAGVLDTSFASNATIPGIFRFSPPVQGQAPVSTAGQGLVVQSDGTIDVVGTELIGNSAVPAIIVERINANGTAAADFTGIQGDGQPTTADAIALGPNNAIYVAGTENAGSADAKAVVARLTFSGLPSRLQLDSTFGSGGVFTSTLGATGAQDSSLAVAPDGRVVIAGQVAAGGGEGVVARLTSTGSLDPSFGSGGVTDLAPGAGVTPEIDIGALVLEPDGAPVVAGDTGETNPGGLGFAKSTSFIAQLTPSGAPDASFAPGSTPAGVRLAQTISGYTAATVTGLALDDQGRLLMATDATSTAPSTPDEGAVLRFLGDAPPTAAFAIPSAVIAGGAAHFDATPSTDAVGAITDYAWDFDGSGAFATDGGGSPTITHTFTTPGVVSVSVRVTNAVGQTSTMTQQVTVRTPGPAQLPGATPRLVLSTTRLAFSVDVNDLNATYIDSNAQTVTVTSGGTAPLSIGDVAIVNSPGGFAISNFCEPTLGATGFSTTCTPSLDSPDSCVDTTLAPGASCSIAVQYQDAGVFSNATGGLEISSNAATSPDVVALAGSATRVGDNPDVGSTHCPGAINGLGGALVGCWTDITGAAGAASDTWAAFGPVTINGQVTLSPTGSADELFDANGVLSATPSTAQYTVLASNSNGTPDTPIGTVDLGESAYVCAYNGKACANTLTLTNRSHYTIHNLPITGGVVFFAGGESTPNGTTCSSAASFVNAALPHLFTSAPVPGAPAPTVQFAFGGCTNASGPNSEPGEPNDGGPANPVTCPGEKTPTPNCTGHTFPPASVHAVVFRNGTGNAAARDDQAGACPDGDVDYSESVPETFVGAMDFGTPFLCFNPATQIWTAGGTFNILGASIATGPPPDDGISFNGQGKFVGGGIQSVDFPGDGLPLAPPVFLNSFGGEYHTNPTLLTARATVNVASVLTITGGAFAVWANRNYPYSYPDGCHDPNCPLPGVTSLHLDTSGRNALTNFAAGASGEVALNLPIVGSLPLASAYVFYYAPAYFEFAGCLGQCDSGLSLLDGAITVTGMVDGQLDTDNGEYNLEGRFGACVNWPVVGSTCLGVDGVVSSAGLGACASISAFGFTGSVDATYQWGGGLNIGLGCDLGPVTVAVQATRAATTRVAPGAHVAQSTGAVTLHLAGGAPSTSIWVKGDGAPPGLTLTGPGGKHLSVAGTAKGTYGNGLLIWPEPKLDETLVGIVRPTAGAWTITPLPGSAGIAKVSYANALAPARITTTVSGTGTKRTLAYRIAARPGQQVTFAERSGEVFHVLGTAHGTQGTLPFIPADGPAGHRQIEALITLSGVHKPALVVGGYTAPGPPQAGMPGRLRLTRQTNSLKVSWAPAANAKTYLATVMLSDGEHASFKRPARTRTVSVAMVGPATSASVKVIALTATNEVGPAAGASIAALHAPGAVTGLKVAHGPSGVAVSWHRLAAAKLYLLNVKVPGVPAYAPSFLTKPRFVSATTLTKLKAGVVATVTVTPLGPTGERGPARSVRYRAPSGSGVTKPHS